MRNNLYRLLQALALTLPIAVTAVDGQEANTKTKRVPVTVALATNFSYEGNSVVLRQLDPVPGDVIVLRAESATAQILSDAIRDLITIRHVSGDSPSRQTLLRRRPSESPVNGKLLPWSERVLKDLRAAPVREVPQVGTARTIRIWLPKTKKISSVAN